MCNLNLLIKTNKIRENQQRSLLNAFNTSCYNSYLRNNDNEGVFYNYKNFLITSENKINYFDNEFLFKESNFILSHQRFTTSGHSLNFAQPFKKENFVFFHNGVINFYDKNNKSDTFNLFNSFLKHFENFNKKYSKDTSIKKAIEKILKNKEGSYSIGIYDIKEKNLYYFKNEKTNINFIMNKEKNLLFISTENDNKEFFDILEYDFKEYDIKENHLYKIGISKHNKILLQELSILKLSDKKEKKNYINYKNINFTSAKEYEKEKNAFNESLNEIERQKDLLMEFKEKFSIDTTKKIRKCNSCQKNTNNTYGHLGYLSCDSCLITYELEHWDQNKHNYIN